MSMTTDGHEAIEYEVSLDVDAAIGDDYLAWLRDHVAQMCALPGFTGATLLEADADEGRRLFVARYRLRDRVALDAYLREHAPSMRADGQRRFGERFRATRRVLRAR